MGEIKSPRVSIGMPVYNGERYIRQALDTLVAQTFTDFELIISDNASTDSTSEICLEYAAQDKRIRYYRNERNMGAAWNFNRVFELSRGEYFMWAAHDDYYDRRYLGACLKAFRTSDAIVLAGTMCKSIALKTGELLLIDHGVSTIGLKAHERFKHYKLTLHCGKKNVGSIFCGVYKRDALRKVMPLKKVIATDHVLLAELSLQGEFVTIQEKLMTKRYGGTSKNFESIARSGCITNPVLIKYSYLVREVLLQRIIFSTNELTLREKITLACWSFSNYVKVHFIPALHRRLRIMVEMNLKSAIREITPPIFRKIFKALLSNKPTKPNKCPFSGVHKTLSDVPKVNLGYCNENLLNEIFEATKAKLNDTRNTQFLPNSRIENNIKNLFPLLIATLLHSKESRITIFDFGGGMGTSYIDCLSYLSSDRIFLHLLDMKPTCDLGKKLFKDVDNIKFYDCFPEVIEDIDIVLMGSSLQYVDDYRGTLLKLLNFKAEYIFMTDYFMGRMKTFATSQVNMQEVTIPMWIFNYEEIISLFEEHNYKLFYKTPNYQPYHDLSNFPKEFALRDSYNFLFVKEW